MSLSPIGSAVFELLSHKHTYIQTYRQTDILLLYSKDINDTLLYQLQGGNYTDN